MSDKGFFYSVWRRLRPERYLSAWLILGIDTTISSMASLVSLLLYDMTVDQVSGKSFFIFWMAACIAASIVMFLSLRTYRAIIRYSTLREIGNLGIAAIGKTALLGLFMTGLVGMHSPRQLWLLSFDFLLTFGALVLLRVMMIALYEIICRRADVRRGVQRVLVYGDSDKSVSQIVRLQNSVHYKIEGFLVYGKQRRGTYPVRLPDLLVRDAGECLPLARTPGYRWHPVRLPCRCTGGRTQAAALLHTMRFTAADFSRHRQFM